MEIEFDQNKCDFTLQERGLDFARAPEVFAGPLLTEKDTRFDYGEIRFMSLGYLDGRMVVLIWTQRGPARRIISMRYANDREKSKYSEFLG
ncbi:MAG: BrnT family toxin [Desulfocapsaceae bacterium]|nr:BrnT family toxin [Desulfocapsaceae bacterium]